MMRTMQLSPVMLLHTLHHSFHWPSEYATLTLNSYNAILTLIAAIL